MCTWTATAKLTAGGARALIRLIIQILGIYGATESLFHQICLEIVEKWSALNISIALQPPVGKAVQITSLTNTTVNLYDTRCRRSLSRVHLSTHLSSGFPKSLPKANVWMYHSCNLADIELTLVTEQDPGPEKKFAPFPPRWSSPRNLDIGRAYIWDCHDSSDNERKATWSWWGPTSPPTGYPKRPSVVLEVASESDAKFHFLVSGWIKPTERLGSGCSIIEESIASEISRGRRCRSRYGS